MAGAAAGAKKGPENLEKWGDTLLDLSGWGLSEIDKASRDFKRFIAGRKEQERKRKLHDRSIKQIQESRRKLKLKKEEGNDATGG